MPVRSADYVAGMRRLAAGVSIVTTRCEEVPAGLTVTAVCSLTAEPPRLLACIHREADAHPLILQSRIFAINLLTLAHKDLAERFGGRTGCFGPARFAEGAWRRGATSAPLLADAAASFDCRLVEAVPAGTHAIFIGEVEAVAFGPSEAVLVYEDRAYRRLIDLDR